MPQLWVEGEVSNFSRPASGHWYFSLKDQDAQVRCAMFRGRNALLRFTPANGQRVLARVRVGLFESRGEYQLQVEHLEDSGVGALRREYDLLRAKLEAEGLFAQALKRPLPTAPVCIGVITSPTGAAIRDILNILGRRFPAARVVIYPSAVQGKEAVGQLLDAVATAAARAECEVLIIERCVPCRCRSSAGSDTKSISPSPTSSPICAHPRPRVPPNSSCRTPRRGAAVLQDSPPASRSRCNGSYGTTKTPCADSTGVSRSRIPDNDCAKARSDLMISNNASVARSCCTSPRRAAAWPEPARA
jgi:hypothetical protein